MPLARILEPEVMDSHEDAVDYDTMDHSQVNRVFVDDLLAAVSQFPAASLKPPARPLDILDLGTGTALIPVELCKRFPHCRVLAVDAAAHMLDLARYHLEANSLTGRIQLAQADAKSLPFEAAQFDVVMSNSILHHIPEPQQVLAEAVRMVRPGGVLLFRDLLRPDSTDDLQRLVDVYAADCNDHQRKLFADSLHAALTLAEVQSLAAALGFAAETVRQTSDRHWTWSARSPSA
jgi:ubiquinone/menaquinone biosynthesis C-methylase UbiE